MGVIYSLATLNRPVLADFLRKHGGKTGEKLKASGS